MPEPLIKEVTTETPAAPTKLSGKASGTAFEYDLTNPTEAAEVVKLLEKAKGADKVFADAAELRKQVEQQKKEAAEAVALRNAIGGLRSDDETTRTNAFLMVARSMGMGPQEANQLWDAIYGADKDEDEPAPKRSTAVKQNEKIDWSQLPDEVIEAAAFIKKAKSEGLDPLQVLRLSGKVVESEGEKRGSALLRSQLEQHPDLSVLRGKTGRGVLDKLIKQATSALKRRVESEPNVDFSSALQDTVDSTVELFKLGRGSVPESDPNVFGVGPGPGVARSTRKPGQQPQLDPKELGDRDALSAFISDVVTDDAQANDDDAGF